MDEILDKILAIMATTKTGFSESFYEMVLKRLVFLGYKINSDDAWSICFSIQKVENHIKNFCNILTIPDGLLQIAADRVCGEFLFAKKQSGQLDIDSIDLSSVVTSIREGDTDVSFNNNTSDETRFNQLLDYMINAGESDFICYRRLKW